MSGLFITRIYPFWLYQMKLEQTTTTNTTNNFDRLLKGKKKFEKYKKKIDKEIWEGS